MGHGEQIYGAIYVKRLVLLDLELLFVSLSFQLLHSTKKKKTESHWGKHRNEIDSFQL